MDIEETLRLHELWLSNKEGGKQADFTGMKLSGYDFSKRCLVWAIFKKCNLVEANFRNAIIEKADFTESFAYKADFSYAKANIATFKDAQLGKAKFVGASLVKADMRDAYMYEADLRYSCILRADILGANISRACIINMEADCPIFRLDIGGYSVAYNYPALTIGCERHHKDTWMEFSDDEIAGMDKNALAFWRVYKDMIFKAIEAVEEEWRRQYGSD